MYWSNTCYWKDCEYVSDFATVNSLNIGLFRSLCTAAFVSAVGSLVKPVWNTNRFAHDSHHVALVLSAAYIWPLAIKLLSRAATAIFFSPACNNRGCFCSCGEFFGIVDYSVFAGTVATRLIDLGYDAYIQKCCAWIATANDVCLCDRDHTWWFVWALN